MAGKPIWKGFFRQDSNFPGKGGLQVGPTSVPAGPADDSLKNLPELI